MSSFPGGSMRAEALPRQRGCSALAETVFHVPDPESPIPALGQRLDLIQGVSDSLAGRIQSDGGNRRRQSARLWTRGGFPRAYRLKRESLVAMD